MGTYWRLHCKTCGVDADMDSINRGDDTILAMLVVAPALLALDGHDVDLRIDSHSVPLWFIGEHAGHLLVAQSERGDERAPSS